jgi:hypothetical protein
MHSGRTLSDGISVVMGGIRCALGFSRYIPCQYNVKSSFISSWRANIWECFDKLNFVTYFRFIDVL